MKAKHVEDNAMLLCSPECDFQYIAERAWELKRHRNTHKCTRLQHDYLQTWFTFNFIQSALG